MIVSLLWLISRHLSLLLNPLLNPQFKATAAKILKKGEKKKNMSS